MEPTTNRRKSPKPKLEPLIHPDYLIDDEIDTVCTICERIRKDLLL
jgi:hypothetical protein